LRKNARIRLFRPSLLMVTRLRGDENDGSSVVGVGEETFYFLAVPFRHPHIEDEARGGWEAAQVQDQSPRGVSHGVIHNCDQKTFTRGMT
jgi:hypothetical protein